MARRRIVVAKVGLDGHDRGVKLIARALRDAGVEVIYTGLHQTPEQVVRTVVQEDADALGLSVLSGAHMTLFAKVAQLMREQHLDDVVLFGGGIIPAEDLPLLTQMGVARIFTPGASMDEVVRWVEANVNSGIPDDQDGGGEASCYPPVASASGGETGLSNVSARAAQA